jgi:hypothetical protein
MKYLILEQEKGKKSFKISFQFFLHHKLDEGLYILLRLKFGFRISWIPFKFIQKMLKFENYLRWPPIRDFRTCSMVKVKFKKTLFLA